MSWSAGSGAPQCRQNRAGRAVSSWQRSQRIAAADSGLGPEGDCDVVIRGSHTVRRVSDRVVSKGRGKGEQRLSVRTREAARGHRTGVKNDAAGDLSVVIRGKIDGGL